MAMTIMNDASAAMTLGELNKNISQLGKQLKKVSSGQRINGAGDAPSEYSISEKMRVRIRALDQDERNVQNGAALLRTAEGAIQSQIEIMKTIKEKVIDADNDTNTDLDRMTIQKEIDQGYEQIQNIAWETTYNGKLLLVGDTEIDSIYTWVVLDEPVTVPDSVMNIIPDEYDTLDGEPGPFAAFKPYTETVSTAAPLLGSASSVSLTGGTPGVQSEPTTAQPATFTMDLGSSASALDGVGFSVTGRGGGYGTQYFVLTTDTGKNYKYGNSANTRATAINISGKTTSQIAEAIASAVQKSYSSGIGSAKAEGTKVKFTTYGTGPSMNTNAKLVQGWSIGEDQTEATVGATSGTPATNSRSASPGTGLFSASGTSVIGKNEQTVTHPAETHQEKDPVTDRLITVVDREEWTETVSPATTASVTKDLSGVASGSGISVTRSGATAYVQFVDGTDAPHQNSEGVWVIGKEATVNGLALGRWKNTGNASGGSSNGVKLSLSNGQVTLTSTTVGAGGSFTVTDGIAAVAGTPGTPGTPGTKVITDWEAVNAYSGDVSSATGGANKGPYEYGNDAFYTIDLSSYDNVPEGEKEEKLNEFISALVGKTMVVSGLTPFEFIDSSVDSSMDAMQQMNGASAIDLKTVRTAVASGASVADAFINLMTTKDSRFTRDTENVTKGLKVSAPYHSEERGNGQTIRIEKGTLSQYTIDFSNYFKGNSAGIPDDLEGKGFRVYCATCPDQWFNFQFTMGGELDATRPKSGSSGADLKTTLINVSAVTDVESLVKTIYDQAHPAMEEIMDGHPHTLHVAADPKKGTMTVYDSRNFDVLSDEYSSWYPDRREKGAKIADGVMDDVIKVERGVYVKDLVIQHTDHASQNIHVRIPQTTLDHIFNFIEGAGGLSNYNVMTAENREMLLGNKAGKKRSGGIAPVDERGALDTALDYLTSANTLIGAQIMRLEMTQSNIVTSRESTTNSESTIRDADMAKEMTDYTKANVLAQAAQSMLAQANQNSSGILSLLQ